MGLDGTHLTEFDKNKQSEIIKESTKKLFDEFNKLTLPDLLSDPKLNEKCPSLKTAELAGLTAIALRSPPRAPKAPPIELNLAVP